MKLYNSKPLQILFPVLIFLSAHLLDLFEPAIKKTFIELGNLTLWYLGAGRTLLAILLVLGLAGLLKSAHKGFAWLWVVLGLLGAILSSPLGSGVRTLIHPMPFWLPTPFTTNLLFLAGVFMVIGGGVRRLNRKV